MGENDVEAVIREQPLSPAARLFHSPRFNCYVIAIMGCKTRINPDVVKSGLEHTLLKHPRFSSKLVRQTILFLLFILFLFLIVSLVFVIFFSFCSWWCFFSLCLVVFLFLFEEIRVVQSSKFKLQSSNSSFTLLAFHKTVSIYDQIFLGWCYKFIFILFIGLKK